MSDDVKALAAALVPLGTRHARPEHFAPEAARILAAMPAYRLVPVAELERIAFHADHEDATDLLAEMFGLKRVKRRDGEWVAEFFGGTEMPFADLAHNYTLVRAALAAEQETRGE